jgi:hypothetical protein
MGIFKSIFSAKTAPEAPTYEIVERHLSIDTHRHQVRLRKGGRELYAEELFQAATKPKDLSYSRLFFLHEKPSLPQFAPSLQEALDWFRGRNLSKDGYGHIWWGDKFIYQCAICQARREAPLTITKVEHVTLTAVIPRSLSLEGWRVVEVETELTGKGTPTKKLDMYKTYPVITWQQAPNQYLCRNCAEKLVGLGRGSEVRDYFVFEIK